MEMARGARPEIFAAPAKKGRTRIPLKKGSIDALRIFLPHGKAEVSP